MVIDLIKLLLFWIGTIISFAVRAGVSIPFEEGKTARFPQSDC